MALSAADLAALPQHTERLPIACVEGWSAGRGPGPACALRDLLDAGRTPPAESDGARWLSLQPDGPFRVTQLPPNVADDPLTLSRSGCDGEPLSLDHGFPVPADRARVVRGCCRPSGWSGSRSLA